MTDKKTWPLPPRDKQCDGYVGDAAYRCEKEKGHTGRHELRPWRPAA